jgi:RND family efflux transporter MFP subunit
MNRLVLPALGVCALGYAVFAVVRTHPRVPRHDPPAPPPVSAFAHVVAGVGLLEANTENVAIGTHLPGVVAKVFVQVGQRVKQNDPLFALDVRHLEAELAVRKAALAAAETKVETTSSNLADAQDQFDLSEALRKERVVSSYEFNRRDFAVKIATARLAEARAEVALGRALLRATETDIERSTARAPMDAEVLQVKVRAGEYAPAGQTATPLLTLGALDPLHLRVDVDEHEAWRIRPAAPATAHVRGNPDLKVPLKFVRFEPLVIPKRSLTGDPTERVDTRVLQVIYQVERGTVPLFVGQQMDVFIEAAPGRAPGG